MFHVAVWGDRPKHMDKAEASEVGCAPMLRNVNVFNSNIARVIGAVNARIHLAVALQPG